MLSPSQRENIEKWVAALDVFAVIRDEEWYAFITDNQFPRFVYHVAKPSVAFRSVEALIASGHSRPRIARILRWQYLGGEKPEGWEVVE